MSTGLRADAERNRRALLTAARAVFGDRGLDASLDEIAKRAGVGSATLYRRFPDRSALVSAVFYERIAAYARAAEEGLAADDAWQGFVGYVTYLCRLQATDRGLSELLTTTLFDVDEELAALRARGLDATERLIARAQATGQLRTDLVVQDLVVLLMANAGVVHRTAAHAPDAWRRHLGLLLDGLRPHPESLAPPPPMRDGIEAAMRAPADEPARH